MEVFRNCYAESDYTVLTSPPHARDGTQVLCMKASTLLSYIPSLCCFGGSSNLSVLLPLPPESWVIGYVPPCLAMISF